MSWLIKHKTILVALFSIVFGLVFVAPIFAQSTTVTFGLTYGNQTGLGNQDIRTTISKVINVALSMLGIVAVVIVLLGGFKWMTAGGNEEKTGEARKLIFAGIMGLAIVLSAFAIAQFVLKQLYIATNSDTSQLDKL